MSDDVRARIAVALAAELEIRRGTVQTWADHIAGVLLALPGIVIMALPEHTSESASPSRCPYCGSTNPERVHYISCPTIGSH